MKQQISPQIMVGIVVLGIAILAFLGYRTMNAAPQAAASNAPTTAAAPGAKVPVPEGRGGIPAEGLQKRDEYNRTHPGAAGSR